MGGRSVNVRYIGAALRLALAHHPLCAYFHEDVYQVGTLRVCRGCLFTIPAFLIGAVVAFLVLPMWGPPVLVLLGLVLGLPQLATYLVRFGPVVRALVKLVGGAGLGLLIVGLLWLGLSLVLLVALFATLAVSFVALQSLRTLRMLRTCRRCPWNMDWDRCPGFGGL